MAKKSMAEKAPFIIPNIDIMYQVDFTRDDSKKRDPETNIHKFGCCFMSNLAIPQYINNRALKREDILHIYNVALEKGWIEYNCAVNNPEEIIRYAAQLLGDTKHTYRNIAVKGVASGSSWNVETYQKTKFLPGPGNVYFCVVDFLTGSSSEYGGHHFQLFSGIGNIMYDPANGTVHKYKGVNKIVIYKVS